MCEWGSKFKSQYKAANQITLHALRKTKLAINCVLLNFWRSILKPSKQDEAGKVGLEYFTPQGFLS